MYMTKLEGTRATNVIKLVMNWQNDNHQNELFYDKPGICPACETVLEDHLHFLCCKDPVLYRLNTKAISKFHFELQKTRTAGVISGIFMASLQALRAGDEPMEPLWKDDEMGRLGKQAWQEQSAIGWSHWVRGRFSAKWSVMQEKYYRSHPDMRSIKTCTGKGWAVRMIKGLITMLLEMWAGRCACLHGHTVAEKRLKKKELLLLQTTL